MCILFPTREFFTKKSNLIINNLTNHATIRLNQAEIPSQTHTFPCIRDELAHHKIYMISPVVLHRKCHRILPSFPLSPVLLLCQ